jgi:hypothetical protein
MCRTRQDSWTAFTYRSTVQRQTGFRYSRLGFRPPRRQLPVSTRDSIVDRLSFLSCRPLFALSTGLEGHSCWIHYEISSSLIS